MAGETPNAANSRRRPTNWNDDRNTNKYYASAQTSVMEGRTGGDAVVNPQTPQMRPQGADIRTTDKYYASMPSAPTAQQIAQAAKKPGKAPPVMGTARQVAHAQASHPLMILSKDEINVVLGNAIDQVRSHGLAVVDVAEDLVTRARTALDLMITRQSLTEDEGRAIQFSKLVADPMPATTVRVPEALNVDPLEFLNRDDSAEVAAQQALVAADPNAHVRQVTEDKTAEVDEGDWMDVEAAAVVPPVPPEVPPVAAPAAVEVPVEAPVNAAKPVVARVRGKRSGRGS